MGFLRLLRPWGFSHEARRGPQVASRAAKGKSGLHAARHAEMRGQVGLRKHHTNKASGGDGIPVELFQILKDDAVKVLHSICQQILKTQ